jgi:aspartate carbamoyltransferase regulatory subunit
MNDKITMVSKCPNPSCSNPDRSKPTELRFERRRLKEMLDRNDVKLWCHHCDHSRQLSPEEKANLAKMPFL